MAIHCFVCKYSQSPFSKGCDKWLSKSQILGDRQFLGDAELRQGGKFSLKCFSYPRDFLMTFLFFAYLLSLHGLKGLSRSEGHAMLPFGTRGERISIFPSFPHLFLRWKEGQALQSNSMGSYDRIGPLDRPLPTIT